jgi:hypothetical protein
MIVPGSINPLLLTSAAAAGGFQVSRSLRFNSADSAYLNRTPGTAGNRRTWTWSGWVKRSAFAQQNLFRGGTTINDTQYLVIDFTSNHELRLSSATTNYLITTQVFRDPSAWYHIVFVFDVTQGTNTNKAKFYVNGVEITTYSTDARGSLSNQDYGVNQVQAHVIGGEPISSGRYLDGYLANIHFIDGQALTPSSFTEVSATTGQLIPLAYTGTYGTNGFYLKFADNSTTAALGTDSSGNGNTWTTNNFSVTAGAGNDSLVDTPTSYGTDTGVGGEVRGNYATLNPLVNPGGSTLSNGNLDCVTATSNAGRVVGSIGVSSGKWYWEVVKTGGSAGQMVGIAPSSEFNPITNGETANSYGYYETGQKYNNALLSSYGSSWTTGNVIGVALDLDAGIIVFYKNNTSQGTAFSGLSGNFVAAVSDDTNGGSTNFSINFGQRAFAYTAPSGFKALCDTNLPEGTITTSGTYTGNGVADGPFVYLNGVPTAMTVGVNSVTFGTDADKLSNGFKLRTTNVLYNQNALSYSYSITTTGAKFKYARAQPNP